MTQTTAPRRAPSRRVREVLQVLNELFPPALADEGDNIGLLVGDPDAAVDRVGVALDISLPALQQSAGSRGGLLVSHHPIFYRQPARRVDASTPEGRLAIEAIRRNVAIIACHSNADWAPGGVNDVLAAKLGLRGVQPFEPLYPTAFRKLVVFVPASHLEAVAEAIFQAGGGVIGAYAKCSFRTPGEGTYVPLAGASPFSGAVGELSREAETRLEVRIPAARTDAVLAAMRRAHPYEEVAFDLYPTERQGPVGGRGRIGRLAKPLTLAALARLAARRAGMEGARFVGDGDTTIETIVVCAGAAAHLIDSIVGRRATALLTGDVRYHEARRAQALNAPVVDLGHYGSEAPFVGELARKLGEALAPLPVQACEPEGDPFTFVRGGGLGKRG
jgi:dinuclear metal center YbgI/SA1388 family protein